LIREIRSRAGGMGRDVEETIRGYLANIDRFNDLVRDSRTQDADLSHAIGRVKQYEYVMRRFRETLAALA
jgi:hypothetical protein